MIKIKQKKKKKKSLSIVYVCMGSQGAVGTRLRKGESRPWRRGSWIRYPPGSRRLCESTLT
ncbi:hypothetical protein PUN28_011371 [Cardiocondyla obscurior]|uniref:Uncharacterized protein n=1 Tax=Cardiocondyla obscurior TaxID=286306 RepID=A0AAW2FIL3_9HYME